MTFPPLSRALKPYLVEHGRQPVVHDRREPPRRRAHRGQSYVSGARVLLHDAGSGELRGVTAASLVPGAVTIF